MENYRVIFEACVRPALPGDVQSSGYWIILVLIKGEDINGME